MADVKPETLKPDIGDGIYVKFQRNPHIFCTEQHNGKNVSTGRRQSGWKIKMVACYRSGYEIAYVSACIHDSNEISTAIPMFSRSCTMTPLVYKLIYLLIIYVLSNSENIYELQYADYK